MTEWTMIEADDARRYQVYNYLAINNTDIQEHWLHIDLFMQEVNFWTMHGNQWVASGWHGRVYLQREQPYAIQFHYMGDQNGWLHTIHLRRALTMECWIGYERNRLHCLLFGVPSINV